MLNIHIPLSRTFKILIKKQNYIILKNISDAEAEKVNCTRYAYKNLRKTNSKNTMEVRKNIKTSS